MSAEQQAWLQVLILMHDRGHTSYRAFMDHVYEEWLDRCIRCDHARIVGRVLWGW